MGRKILAITDVNMDGSGYMHMSLPLLMGLHLLGYDIKLIGLSYDGREHSYPFSIIPVSLPENAATLASKFLDGWKPDVVLVMLDIPVQIAMLKILKKDNGPKYIGVTPMENGPLSVTWAAGLLAADWMFFISELGKREARKAGVTRSDHIQIGIDSDFWRVPSIAEKKELRSRMGISDDEFVVFTNADNQERKNLWAAYKAISILKNKTPRKIKYIVLSRVNEVFGWNLPELALSMGIKDIHEQYERGMPDRNLWGLYAISDAFLLTSKAEGLGLPILEAMACGVPVVGTDTGAIHELLEDGRGWLANVEYHFGDVWGNSKRDMVSVEHAAECLLDILQNGGEQRAAHAREYVERERKWEFGIEQLHHKIEELCNEEKKAA